MQSFFLHALPSQLFVGGALISLGSEEVRNMRPKLRVVLVRFIAKVSFFLCTCSN